MANFDQTICWDCSKACGGCSWSDHFAPVNGWVAIPRKVYASNDGMASSFIVRECPMFDRDAVGFGMKWSKKNNTINRRRKKND